MLNFYLYKKVILSTIILLFCIFITKRMIAGKDVIKGVVLTYKNCMIRVLYMRILPILIMIRALNMVINPILDMVDTNKNTYSTIGVLNAISSSNNPKSHWIGEYTVRIDDKTYRIPVSLQKHSLLKKGVEYRIRYYKHSRLVYSINRVETTCQ